MATKQAYKLGDLVQDEITKFEGVAFGRADYLYGCAQVLVTPNKLSKDGSPPDSRWFDEQRVKLVKRQAAPMNPTMASSGGPQNSPPERTGPRR